MKESVRVLKKMRRKKAMSEKGKKTQKVATARELTPKSEPEDSTLPEKRKTRRPIRRVLQRDEKVLRPPKPVLRFSPTAWAKLVYFRDHGDTEIGGFGVTPIQDLVFIEDFVTIKQRVSEISVSFDDEAVADFFETQCDAGRKPEQFARIWLHTHPGNCPQPSGVDEETFQRVFGRCEWAVMFILDQGGKTYARLRFSVGPGGETMIPVSVDYSRPFGSSDHDAWKAEYEANIIQETYPRGWLYGDSDIGSRDFEGCGSSFPDHWKEELEAMDPHERRFILNELGAGYDPWEEDFEEEEPWE